MFKKLETVTRMKISTTSGSHAVIYKGKVKTFSMNVSETALRRAKLTIGDRVTISLGEASDKTKWLILEQDTLGYKILPVKAPPKLANGKIVNIDGTYQRGLLKTTKVEGFLLKVFGDSTKDWADSEVKTQAGMAAFPLEQTKKAWF